MTHMIWNQLRMRALKHATSLGMDVLSVIEKKVVEDAAALRIQLAWRKLYALRLLGQAEDIVSGLKWALPVRTHPRVYRTDYQGDIDCSGPMIFTTNHYSWEEEEEVNSRMLEHVWQKNPVFDPVERLGCLVYWGSPYALCPPVQFHRYPLVIYTHKA
jgi:hypothetical protein